jgi:hypothetical protein
LSFTLTFTSSQIDKIKFACFNFLFVWNLVFRCLFDVNCKKRVTPTWVFIHCSLTCVSPTKSGKQSFFCFCDVLSDDLSQIFYIRAFIRVCFYLKMLLRSVFTFLSRQEVYYVFIVNF